MEVHEKVSSWELDKGPIRHHCVNQVKGFDPTKKIPNKPGY